MLQSRRSLAVLALLVFCLSALPLGAAVRKAAAGRHVRTNTAVETVIHSFTGTPDGQYPQARLMREAGGSLYGTTLEGGVYGCDVCGTVFQLTPLSQGRYRETIVHRFKQTSDGAYPAARLFEDKSGNFFGSTARGGDASHGTLFETSLRGGSRYRTTVLFRFNGANGSRPLAPLIAGSDGALYGTTANGGGGGGCDESCGTVFKVVPNGRQSTVSILYHFAGNGDGANPVAPLIVDGSGILYGTTEFGGSSQCAQGCGTVFSLTPFGSRYEETILHAFSSGNDGALPQAGLLADKDGALYGTTSGGGYSCPGGSGCGTVFKLTPTRTGYAETILYRFLGSNDGAEPLGNLVIDKNGTLYGTTALSYGLNACNCGVAFALTPSGSTYHETIVHAFSGQPNDGASPQSGLVLEAPTNTLFGTTVYGGSANLGTAFQIQL